MRYVWLTMCHRCKESTCQVGAMGSIPGSGRSAGEEKGYPTPVFRPGELHGPYTPWGRKEANTTEQLQLSVSLSSLCRTFFFL